MNRLNVPCLPQLAMRSRLYTNSAKRLRIARTASSLAILALTFSPMVAQAGTNTATMAISATVQATCTISATPMAFGTYTGSVVASTATLSVTCTNTSPYTVGLNAGLGTSPTATVTTRHMTGASAALNYVLTQDSGHATNWGNTPGTDTPASANGTGSAVVSTVYGQIAAGQYVNPGSYTDTITATVNF